MSLALLPVRWINVGAEGFTINIHVEPPLLASDETMIDAAVNAWYEVGANGGFGEAGFHWVDKLPARDSVLRYTIDIGSSHPDHGISALQEALTRLADVRINEIMIDDEWSD